MKRRLALAGVALCAAAGPILAQSTTSRASTSPVRTGQGNLSTPSDVVVTQSVSQAVTTNTAFCGGSMHGHTDTWYYRVFDISGLGGDLEIQSVEIGIWEASNDFGAETQPVRFRVYDSGDLNDTLIDANIVHESTVDVPNQWITIQSVPVSGTLTSGSMILEVHTPDGNSEGNFFFLGSNSAGETGPGYFRAVDCGLTEPTLLADAGFPNSHMVMNVNGKLVDAPGVRFCTSVPNSTGLPAVMSATGSNSVASDDLTLRASSVPNSASIFFHGTNRIQVPFGNGGSLCAGGAIKRLLPPAFANGGVATRTVLPGAVFVPPVDVHFQCWFRDTAAGGDAFNTSDGYTVSFTN